MRTQRDFFARTPQTTNWQLFGFSPPKSKRPSGNWFSYPSPVNRCTLDGVGMAFCRSNQFNPQINSLNSKCFGRRKIKIKKKRGERKSQNQTKLFPVSVRITKEQPIQLVSPPVCTHGACSYSQFHVLDNTNPPDLFGGCNCMAPTPMAVQQLHLLSHSQNPTEQGLISETQIFPDFSSLSGLGQII